MRRVSRFLLTSGAGLALLAASDSTAEVRLPAILGSHMVVQQERPINVWGWADPGESITVELAGLSGSTTASAGGTFSVELEPLPAGGPHVMTIAGENTITLEDVLVGEVWVGSGQSNMEWGIKNTDGWEEDVAAADFPMLRIFTVAKVPAEAPLADVQGEWRVCSPESLVAEGSGFSAVSYHFGREVHLETGLPVGMIASSWGGTRIEPWTPPVGFAQVPALATIHEQVLLRDPTTTTHKARLSVYLGEVEEWLSSARGALAASTPPSAAPAFPAELLPTKERQAPTTLYNGMIAPIVPFAIRGAIWYQGESNNGEGMLYTEKMKALVGGWRTIWNEPELPFYYVQIAPYRYGDSVPNILPEFWEGQAAAEREIPGTGMVVINDVGNVDDIHPRNKKDVGRRLAFLALNRTYGREDIVDSGPTFASMAAEGATLRVNFASADGGLVTRDGEAPTWFEIIDGEEGGFVQATATIDGSSVLLSAEGVDNPVAMRFAWHKLAEPNLANLAGLPAGAFRAGEVPERDSLAMHVPEAKDYRLVYDLDLTTVGPQFGYTLDHSKQVIAPFDRVAYCLELENDSDSRFVYVSMDAFTTDATKIGVPTAASGARFQQPVANMNVHSNVPGVVTGEGLSGGHIEFWPNNYQQANVAGVPGASGSLYDFGDGPSDPTEGYGCMQVHNVEAKQTILAFNHWRAGRSADVGIGNNPGEHPDWTFSKSAEGQARMRLRVLVREAAQ